MGGNDQFRMGGAFTAGDKIDGEVGADALVPDGDYSGAQALVLASDTLDREDTFAYGGASESTSTAYDSISDFDALLDQFDLTVGVANILARSGSIDSTTFDANLGDAVGDALINAAVLVTATGGDLLGHTFLVADADGDTLYGGGNDYVIDITGFTGALTAGNSV